jgi:glycosyltransferase involved in cell wall biosynthesis
VTAMTVLLPTHNRASVLRHTLQTIAEVDQPDDPWDLVVIDNNSRDDTRGVVTEFMGRLPITYLSESRPGKNCALNKALREHPLNEIVVFADDDITPDRNWLTEIHSAVMRNPDISVFGGRIDVQWPDGFEPQWATAPWIRSLGFSWHSVAENEALYVPPACPFGPNYWVRKTVFSVVTTFDETIGPRPNDRIMGSETSFLMELQRKGIQMLYCPQVRVRHRIAVTECTVGALRRRAYTFGRRDVRLFGLHRRRLYERSKPVWWLVIGLDYIYAAARYVLGFMTPEIRRRCETTVTAMIRFGVLAESRRKLRTEAQT